MSGILNKKQRFVDTVITDEGRRQLASGEFKIEFATFSDSEAFYRADLASGTFDMQQLLMLEGSRTLTDCRRSELRIKFLKTLISH